jgi:hypothetical protein
VSTITIRFDPERAKHFLDCLQRDGPVTPPPSEGLWTIDNLLTLAGVCQAVVAATLLDDVARRYAAGEEHPEHVEAACAGTRAKLQAAAAYVRNTCDLFLADPDSPHVMYLIRGKIRVQLLHPYLKTKAVDNVHPFGGPAQVA